VERAAGILFRTPEGKILLTRRTDVGNLWAVPGGRIEEGETAQDAARREAKEETGFDYAGALIPLSHRVKDGVDFTTFTGELPGEFAPKLNHEHDLYRWSTVEDALDQGALHPGVQIALLHPDMDELEIAKAMMMGEISSPQRYQNILLIALRITGTGASYRGAINEHVWRDPSLYLNDQFLQRCNGLTVIVEHPDAKQLNSKEFRDRAVGSILLPYIQGDEVWGIAKIYDDATARLLETEKLSTSPAVVFKPDEEGKRIPLEDGTHILIEGKPNLLDHLAICILGVWDKGGPAAGISNSQTDGDTNMADVKADAAAAPESSKQGEQLDTILSHLDSLHKKIDAVSEANQKTDARLDAIESKKDAEEKAEKKDAAEDKEKADAKDEDKEEKKDAKADGEIETKEKEQEKKSDEKGEEKDDSEKEEKKMDSRHDSVAISELIRREVARQVPAELKADEREKFVQAQVKAEKVCTAFGDSAPRWLNGETLMQYRKRLMRGFQQHSPVWKGSDFVGINDEATVAAIEKQVYADAMIAARNPVSEDGPVLRAVNEADRTGRMITKFYGSPGACWDAFKMPSRALSGINKHFDN